MLNNMTKEKENKQNNIESTPKDNSPKLIQDIKTAIATSKKITKKGRTITSLGKGKGYGIDQARINTAGQLTELLKWAYKINSSAAIGITILSGLKLPYYQLDPITTIVSVITLILVPSMGSIITKLLNK